MSLLYHELWKLYVAYHKFNKESKINDLGTKLVVRHNVY